MKRIAKSTLAAAVVTVNALFSTNSVAGPLSELTRVNVQKLVEATVPSTMSIGKIEVKSVVADDAKRTVTVDVNETYAYVPFTHDSISRLVKRVAHDLPQQYAD